MTVLMINVVCGIRSTGRICTDLATELEAQGHEVKIAYGREDVPEQFQKYAVRIGTDFDVKFHGIKARLFDGCGWGSKKATERFIEWVKEFNPDVIHLHNIHGYYINVEVLFNYLRTCEKKIIWTLHDCWAFTGHSAFCDAVNCEKWITGCDNCPNMKEYPASFTDHSKKNWEKKKQLMQMIPNLYIVTPSKWLAGLVRKSFLEQYPVTVIHNGIDTSQFFPLQNDFREYYRIADKFVLLGVATAWDEMKGLSDYLKLASLLGDDYQVVLVGLTKEQIERLPSNVVGIERTNSVRELSYIYSSADLYLNLSYCENYPTVNLEAVACGTPVLTYNTGGSPESAQAGIVVPKGDLNAVVEAVMKCREDRPSVNIDRNKIDKSRALNEYLESYRGGYWEYKASIGLLGKKIVLGVAAVWDKRKGLEDIVTISKNVEAKVIVVGVTEKQKLNLPEHIAAYTRTNNVEELRKLYAVSDVFVNPTYEDNFPTTNIEALACGTPVITYDTGGSPESAGNKGIVVKKGDIAKLISMVKNNKPNNIQDTDFDKKYASERYVELYKSIIET